MNRNNQPNKSDNSELEPKKVLLGNHCWLLGTDVWQFGQQKEIQALFPNHSQLTKLIQIAQIFDKYQKEITYYQTRIRNVLAEISQKGTTK